MVDDREFGYIKDILGTYECAFGQAINFNRSSIFFSSNCSNHIRTHISSISGIYNPLDYEDI